MPIFPLNVFFFLKILSKFFKLVFKYCSWSFFSLSLILITFLKYEIFVFSVSLTPRTSLLKFNFGSQLAMGSAADVDAISNIYINTNLAAAAGVVVAIIGTSILYGKVDLTMALNGALGGLVAITAEPLAPSPILAIFIGGVGSALVILTVPL